MWYTGWSPTSSLYSFAIDGTNTVKKLEIPASPRIFGLKKGRRAPVAPCTYRLDPPLYNQT